MASLLPPEHAISIRYSTHPLDEALSARYDAVIVLCTETAATRHIKRLPHAALWQSLQALSHKDGATPNLIARLPNRTHTLMAIGFIKDNASAFNCLALSARLVKEAKIVHCKHVLLDIIGLEESQLSIAREALLAATLAAAAPMPEFKSKPSPQVALQSLTLRHGGNKPNVASALATHAGNYLARWLTTLPPNHLN
jgi:leucyl aminopeptidase